MHYARACAHARTHAHSLTSVHLAAVFRDALLTSGADSSRQAAATQGSCVATGDTHGAAREKGAAARERLSKRTKNAGAMQQFQQRYVHDVRWRIYLLYLLCPNAPGSRAQVACPSPRAASSGRRSAVLCWRKCCSKRGVWRCAERPCSGAQSQIAEGQHLALSAAAPAAALLQVNLRGCGPRRCCRNGPESLLFCLLSDESVSENVPAFDHQSHAPTL